METNTTPETPATTETPEPIGSATYCPEDVAREFFESLIPSGEFYAPEGSGVSIRGKLAVRNLTRQDGCRDTLAQFIRRARKAARATATPAA